MSEVPPGSIQDVGENTHEFDEHGGFAVEEHKNKADALLEFEKVVNVKKQTVSGMLYYLALEVKEGGQHKYYEAKVSEKAWMDFRALQDFKPVEWPSTVKSND